jgi:predicted nucleic acid-binding protein
MPPVVFVDTNIIVDFLFARQPFDRAAARFFDKAHLGEVKACVPASVFPFLFYLLSKSLPTKKDAWQAVSQFRLLVKALPVDESVLDLALLSDFKDLEDAMQYQVAIQHGAQYFLTRNVKDFKVASIPVLSAEDFLTFL